MDMFLTFNPFWIDAQYLFYIVVIQDFFKMYI